MNVIIGSVVGIVTAVLLVVKYILILYNYFPSTASLELHTCSLGMYQVTTNIFAD